MLIGALLILTWLVLLIRYPLRAVPISLGAVLGLALVAGWVLWQEHREDLDLHVRVVVGGCEGTRARLHAGQVERNERAVVP